MKLRPGTPEEVGMSPQRVQRVAERAGQWVAQGIMPALVVLVARRGVVVLHEAFGRLTQEPDSPPLPRDALFPLASLTKPITATAAMILVEEGLIGLNRPVRDYLPEFVGEGKAAVMLHHLLTHTSGLREADLWEYARERESSVEMTPPDLNQHPWIHRCLSLWWDAPLWKPPGTEMSYADQNYDWLGEIVRRVSGRSLADFARERIFAPLGMDDSHFIVPPSMRPRLVRRPAEEPASHYETDQFLGLPLAAEGAFSTAADVAILGQLFLDRGIYGEQRILSPATVARMTHNQIPGVSSHFNGETFPEASWGYGWDVKSNKKAKEHSSLTSPATFSHGGFGGVFLWVDPVYQIVGVFFSVHLQSQPWNADLFANAVTAAVIDA